jgi:predicted RNA-binding Zn ribbon-like protein
MKPGRYNPDDESLIGGVLCLDFTNTVGSWADSHGTEKLRDYDDLVAWGGHAGALAEELVPRLWRAAAKQPETARSLHARAIALRDALYTVLRAHVDERRLPAGKLALVNREVSTLTARSRLKAGGAGFEWKWGGAEDGLERILWPIARSISDLLTSTDLTRVRHCANDECGWLFLDASRNGSRRWCSMRDCGNRAKVNRYNARRRSSEQIHRETRLGGLPRVLGGGAKRGAKTQRKTKN